MVQQLFMEQASVAFPSIPFLGSIWTALDDVHSSEFHEAACACRPFLDEFTGCMQATADAGSNHRATPFTVGAAAKLEKPISSSFLPGEVVMLLAESIRPTLCCASLPAERGLLAEDLQPTLSSSSATGNTEAAGDVQTATTLEAQSSEVPSSNETQAICFAREITELPYLKSRPIGVTGYHSFICTHFRRGLGGSTEAIA